MSSQVTGGRRAVVAVLLPREHLPFIRHWCQHHIDQGWEVVLYDNTGSIGSRRDTCSYNLKRHHPRGRDGRGNDYGSYTAALSDEVVQAMLRAVVKDLPVRVVPWQPRDSDGNIFFDQVEAYVDFIRRSRAIYEWAAFIDADEYLRCAPGRSWTDLLSAVEEQHCSRIVLEGVEYQSRWTADGKPLPLADLQCDGTQVDAFKNVVRLAEVRRADIHYAWTMSGHDQHARVDVHQYWFDHYRGPSRIAPRPPTFEVRDQPLRTYTDESIPVDI